MSLETKPYNLIDQGRAFKKHPQNIWSTPTLLPDAKDNFSVSFFVLLWVTNVMSLKMCVHVKAPVTVAMELIANANIIKAHFCICKSPKTVSIFWGWERKQKLDTGENSKKVF